MDDTGRYSVRPSTSPSTTASIQPRPVAPKMIPTTRCGSGRGTGSELDAHVDVDVAVGAGDGQACPIAGVVAT